MRWQGRRQGRWQGRRQGRWRWGWPGATPTRLRVVCAALAFAVVLTGVSGWVLVENGRAAVRTADTRTSRALVAARTARAAVVEADRVTVHGFLTHDVLLGGPGQRYQDSIKTATQALEQVAETPGADSELLQGVNVQLVTYIGLIEQADATARAEAGSSEAGSSEAGGSNVSGGSSGSGLGVAYLWYASKLLHAPGGLLAMLQRLGDAQQRRLQARPWSLGSGALAACLIVVVGLVLAMAGAQWWLGRRFRRVLNLPLVLATAGALVAGGWTTTALLHSERGYRETVHTQVNPLVTLWQGRAWAMDADGQSELSALLRAQCPPGAPCEIALAQLTAQAASTIRTATAARSGLPADVYTATAGLLTSARDTLSTATGSRPSTAMAQAIEAESMFNQLDSTSAERARTAQNTLTRHWLATDDLPGVRTVTPLLWIAVLALVLLGFQPRIREYQLPGGDSR